jgi:hypothetical protein
MDSGTEKLVHEVLKRLGMSSAEWKARPVEWRVARLQKLFENDELTWSNDFTSAKWKAALKRGLERRDGVDAS